MTASTVRTAAVTCLLLASGAAHGAGTGAGSGAMGATAVACGFFLDSFEPIRHGSLAQPGGDGMPVEYLSSGGYLVEIDHFTITVTDPLGVNRIEHWGDPHENLNGKHLKDWEGSRRSVLLGDGTQLTMDATGPQGVVVLTSIYDGHHNVQVDNAVNLVLHESVDRADSRCRERTQHDGETAQFSTDATTGVASYMQLYGEDASFQRTPTPLLLGTTGGFANPNQTNDYYDDPRLGHT